MLHAALATMATLPFLPPVLPREYSYSLTQSYVATTVSNNETLNRQLIVGSQYWSLEMLSTRGMVSSGPGIDKGLPTAALNRLTVTNYSDASPQASLETDLVKKTCIYFPVEGGAAYAGYDYYRNFIAGASAAGIPVVQSNESSFVRFGRERGPVNIWRAQPPSAIGRTLVYTIAFKAGSNELVAYEITGVEKLPNSQGEMVDVNLVQSEVRSNYQSVTSFADGFFDVDRACFFAPSSPPTTFDVGQKIDDLLAMAGATLGMVGAALALIGVNILASCVAPRLASGRSLQAAAGTMIKSDGALANHL